MKEHEIQKPIRMDDGLGFTYEGFEKPSKAYLYISKPTASDYNQNELYTQRYEATAFTLNALPVAALIDSSWKVESCEPHKQMFVLGLSRFGEANG